MNPMYLGVAWTPQLGWWLADLALRGSVLLFVVLAVLAITRHRSAAERHLVGMAGLLAMAALPLAMIWLPAGFGVLPSFFARASRLTETGAVPSPFTTQPVWIFAVLGAWAGVGLVLAARAFIASRRLESFWRGGRPLPAADSILASTRRGMRLPAAPAVRTSDAIDLPLTFGLLEPKILMPAEAEAWDRDRLSWVLLHEQAHVARHDPLAQAVTIAVCCLFWWQPLVWRLGRRLELLREHAADDLVLSQRSDAAGYARLLVDIAESLRGRPINALGLSMARPSQLNARLKAMLDETADRRRTGPAQTVAAGSVFVLVLMLLAAMPGDTGIDYGRDLGPAGFGHGGGGHSAGPTGGHSAKSGHASGDHGRSHASGGGHRGHGGHSESGLSGSGHAGAGHASSGLASSGHASSGHARSGHAGSGHTGSGHTGSGHTGSGHTGSDNARSGHRGSVD